MAPKHYPQPRRAAILSLFLLPLGLPGCATGGHTATAVLISDTRIGGSAVYTATEDGTLDGLCCESGRFASETLRHLPPSDEFDRLRERLTGGPTLVAAGCYRRGLRVHWWTVSTERILQDGNAGYVSDVETCQVRFGPGGIEEIVYAPPWMAPVWSEQIVHLALLGEYEGVRLPMITTRRDRLLVVKDPTSIRDGILPVRESP